MWNRPVYLLWIKIRIRGSGRFALYLPIPLVLALEALDTWEDLSRIAGWFAPRARRHDGWYAYLPSLLRGLQDVLWELTFYTGPLDLVDIRTSEGTEHVSVRISTF